MRHEGSLLLTWLVFLAITVSRVLVVEFSALLSALHENLSDILLSAMWELLSDELWLPARLRLLALYNNSSNTLLVVDVHTFKLTNHGRCNVVADSELNSQWWQFWFCPGDGLLLEWLFVWFSALELHPSALRPKFLDWVDPLYSMHLLLSCSSPCCTLTEYFILQASRAAFEVLGLLWQFTFSNRLQWFVICLNSNLLTIHLVVRPLHFEYHS